MPTSYQLRVYDPWDGQPRAVITNWRTLHLERHVNTFDNMQLTLNEDAPEIQYFVLDAIIEVWRRLDRPGSTWYLETTLLHRTSQHDFTEGQNRIFTSYSRGLLDLIHRRNIEYFATTAQTLKGGPGETVIKEFVDENCGPGANSSLRLSTGIWTAVIPGLELEPNAGRGAIWKGAKAYENVLDVISEISLTTSVDFNIVRIAPLTFEFRCYFPQLGTDRSSYILFSPELANMTDIVHAVSRTEEANAIVVGGQGEAEDRRIFRMLNAETANDSPWNVIEVNRDGRSQPTVEELQTEAETAAKELAPQESYNFKVLQTDVRKYGGEYFLGDKVRAAYRGVETVKKITGVTIEMTEGRETIDLDFMDF